jgi:hypothetical protein
LAQNANFEPGYVVINNDSTSLLIERNDEISLSKEIHFRLGEQEGVYTPGQINGFGFKADPYSFEATEVNLKTAEYSIKTLMFSKIMLRGSVNLYKVLLPKDLLEGVYIKNDYAYIIKKDNTFYTLWQREPEINTTLEEDKRYTGLLRFIFQNCPEIASNEFDKVYLQDAYVINITKRYNECISPDKQVKLYSTKVKPVFKHGFHAEYNRLTIPQEQSSGDFFSTIDYDTPGVKTGGISGGYFFEIIKPNVSTKSAIRLGISYASFTYNTYRKYTQVTQSPGSPLRYDVATTTFTVKDNMIKIPLLLQRYFGDYRNSTVPFFNVGITLIGSKNELLPGYLSTLGLGLYHKRLKFETGIQTVQFKSTITLFSLGYCVNKI